MRQTLTFVHGLLDHPRGATVFIADYAHYRAYRAGRALSYRLRTGTWTQSVHRLGPEDFAHAVASPATPGGGGTNRRARSLTDAG